jgi:hypothetical protein
MSQGMKLTLLLVVGAIGSIVIWGMLLVMSSLVVEAIL